MPQGPGPCLFCLLSALDVVALERHFLSLRVTKKLMEARFRGIPNELNPTPAGSPNTGDGRTWPRRGTYLISHGHASRQHRHPPGLPPPVVTSRLGCVYFVLGINSGSLFTIRIHFPDNQEGSRRQELHQSPLRLRQAPGIIVKPASHADK